MEKNCMNRIMNWTRHLLRNRCEGGKVFGLLGLGIWMGFCPMGQAVIIVTGSGNTSAPSDDPGWNYVGRVNTSGSLGSGVYLGGFNHNGSYSHWVLTAPHIGDGNFTSFTIGGSSYNAVPNSLVQIRNPTSTPDDPFGLQTLSTYTDLAVFQIMVGTTNNLPTARMSISSTAPALGSEVLGIGWGRNRQATQTAWNSSWSAEVSLCGTNAAYLGWKYGTGQTKRWGKNRVENIPLTAITNHLGGGDYRSVKVITTDFDESGVTRGSYGAVLDEFQAAPGDSGGGLFYKNGSAWELAGIFTTIGRFRDQPNNSVVFGNETYTANLSLYRANILAVVPEPRFYGLAFGLFALVFATFLRFLRQQQKATSHR